MNVYVTVVSSILHGLRKTNPVRAILIVRETGSVASVIALAVQLAPVEGVPSFVVAFDTAAPAEP